MTKITTMVWSTHLEPGILECEVKWALGSITTNKASRGDGIPVHLFQILKDDAVKVLHSICQQIWKTQQWSQDWKVSFHSNPKERHCQRMFKLWHNCIHLTHCKVMLKILQARFQQYMNHELPDVQAGFRSQSSQRSNCQYPLDHRKSKRVPEKHLLLPYWISTSNINSFYSSNLWSRYDYYSCVKQQNAKAQKG